MPTEENDYLLYAVRCKNGKGKRLVMQKLMETDAVFEGGVKRAVYRVEKIIKGKVKFTKFLLLKKNNN